MKLKSALSTLILINGLFVQANELNCYEQYVNSLPPEQQKQLESAVYVHNGQSLSDVALVAVPIILAGSMVIGYKYIASKFPAQDAVSNVSTGSTIGTGIYFVTGSSVIALDLLLLNPGGSEKEFAYKLNELTMDASVKDGSTLQNFSEKIIQQLQIDESKISKKYNSDYSVVKMKDAVIKVITENPSMCASKTALDLNLEITNRAISEYRKMMISN